MSELGDLAERDGAERRGAPPRRRRWVVAFGVVAVLAAAGAWVLLRDSRADPTTLGGPGTPLGDGFSVVEGTRLLGTPIPFGPTGLDGEQRLYENAGWTANLVVTGGDPDRIVGTYLEQAAEVGIDLQTEPSCVADAEMTYCGGAAWATDGTDTREARVTLLRGEQGGLVSDHVILWYSEPGVVGQRIEDPRPQRDPSPPPVPPPPSPSMPPLPDTGEPIGTAGEVNAEVLVQEGSRLAGPPRLHLNDATGGIVAVLELTGDPQDVFSSYLDHLADLDIGGTDAGVERRVDDARVTTAYTGNYGGDYFVLTMIERPGEPTWLAIEANHD